MTNDSAPTPEHILQIGLGFWASKVLLSAVEMRLFTELAHGPENFEALSGRLGLHPRSARDFLDALVALGFLQRTDSAYSNTPATDFFLDRRKPSYVGGFLEMANHRLYSDWGKLTEGLRSGKAQGGLADGDFASLYATMDPARLREIVSGFSGIGRPTARAISTKFPWAQYRTFVDVGTAQGDTAAQIALAHAHLTGAGFDLPEVAPVFEDYAASLGLSSRLKFVPGSFFDDSLPSADVVVMGHILHDWNLDVKRMLIRKAYEAIPAGGAFIVFEAIIDDDRSKNAFGLMMSLNMLIQTSGGFDFTGADCQGWMKDAGFRETRAEHLVGPDSMVIGIK
ncbi:MAG: methyltransferase [Acidobacteriaceae bacterium]|nr:methyltransferase [Acidobacteriaceae bacterium]